MTKGAREVHRSKATIIYIWIEPGDGIRIHDLCDATATLPQPWSPQHECQLNTEIMTEITPINTALVDTDIAALKSASVLSRNIFESSPIMRVSSA